jgi:hypothetical protein
MEALFTQHEARYGHIHKTLGLLALIHYIYRFYNFLAYGTMGFGTSSSWLYILSHAALSGTSLIFYIPSARSITSPMIWPEFRAHSIIFAYRSLVAMSLTELTISDPITRFVTVLGTLLLADGATKYFKMEGVTTMRDMPFPDWVSQTARTQLNYYYSVSQVLATMSILFSPSMERAFIILFPIQIAAFLMTLVRKKIITPLQWHILYAFSLFMNYLYALLLLNITHTEIVPVLFYISSVFFCFLRFGFRVNKYILWIGIGAIYIFTEYQKEKIEMFFLE